MYFKKNKKLGNQLEWVMWLLGHGCDGGLYWCPMELEFSLHVFSHIALTESLVDKYCTFFFAVLYCVVPINNAKQ